MRGEQVTARLSAFDSEPFPEKPMRPGLKLEIGAHGEDLG